MGVRIHVEVGQNKNISNVLHCGCSFTISTVGLMLKPSIAKYSAMRWQNQAGKFYYYSENYYVFHLT